MIFGRESVSFLLVETNQNPLPEDLASAHAMIVLLRETLVVAQSEAKVRALEVERLKFLLAKARREAFGQSSERGKLIIEQLELAIEDLEATQGAEEAKAEIAAPELTKQKPARTPRGPRKLPDNLPVERVEEPAPCACGKCGGSRLRKLGEEVTQTLECEPRRWKIIERVRGKFTCRDCESVTEAPAPSHPIPRGFAGPSLLAMILVDKFLLHQPLNRQSATFAREGVEIDTSTLADRVGACVVALDPMVEAIRKHVLAAERLHADDTTVPVLARKKAKTCRLWVYLRDDRPFGGTLPPAAFLEYSPTRHGEYPRAHLKDWVGLMQADAFSGFNELYEATRKPGPIIEAACWAHARRKFFELAKLKKAPIAIEAVRRIDELFEIERSINGKPPDERKASRQAQSKPLIEALDVWLRQQRGLVSAKSEIAKAINYSLNQWRALARFLDDGRICLSNNAAERGLRGAAIGRVNWMFAGSDEGARRAAAVYTLIETCKLNDVDPKAWLAHVLAKLPDHPAKRIDELLPWNWKVAQKPAAHESAVSQAA